ncbi:MAG: LNS2 domain-containing protein [Planctomycetota bacterium]
MRRRDLLPALLLAACAPRDKPEAKLQGYDVLVPPGREATLAAKLEKRGVAGINPDLRGEPVVFRFRGTLLGRAATAADGLASLAWKPPGPGEHEIVVEVAPESRYRGSALLRVFVRGRERPALVVDLDGTVCAASSWEVAVDRPEEQAAVPGAAAALVRLAERYDVIYLTARDDALLAKSRRWLDLRGFPRGPVLVRDLSLGNLSAGRYKRERLAALRKDFRLAAGVGDRKEDAEAYLSAGMSAILVGDEDDVPEGARTCADWEEVARVLSG